MSAETKRYYEEEIAKQFRQKAADQLKNTPRPVVIPKRGAQGSKFTRPKKRKKR